jgi:acyl-CoA hydrolase
MRSSMRTFQGCNKTSLCSRYQLTTAGRLLENSNMKRKVISAADAAALVNDGDTLTTSGFVGIGVPDELLAAFEARFLDVGVQRDLSLVFAAGLGDGAKRGLN